MFTKCGLVTAGVTNRASDGGTFWGMWSNLISAYVSKPATYLLWLAEL